jgi:hypothetical protein
MNKPRPMTPEEQADWAANLRQMQAAARKTQDELRERDRKLYPQGRRRAFQDDRRRQS